MKKLMFMMNSLYGGGAEKVLQTILRHLDYNKYDVTLYSMHREEWNNSLYPEQIHYRVVFDEYRGASKLIALVFTFWQKVKGKVFTIFPAGLFYNIYIHGKYDVEIAFIEGESTKIVSGSTNKRSKKIAWVHIDLVENPWTSFLYKNNMQEAKAYSRFDNIICVSEAVKKAFQFKYSIKESKMHVIYNPIDKSEILSKRGSACISGKSGLRIVAVGRLVNQKGFDRLLRIIYRLKKEGFFFSVYILGEGEERKELEDFIKQNTLENMVQLLGYQKNPYTFMFNCDLLVCSSRAEGFSTVLAEGIILGLPIISTDCAGVRELFGNARCGIITENSEEALYQALRQVLLNPNQLSIYKKESEKRQNVFDLAKTMKLIEGLFDE